MSTLTNLCRICLSKDLGFSLFEDAEIISKLELCLQEQVLDQVGYPQQICKTCKDKLDKACDFILKYKNTCQFLESGIFFNETNDLAVKIEPIFINSCDYGNDDDNIDDYDEDNIDNNNQEAEHNSKDESKSHDGSQSSLKKILSNFKHITVKKIKKEPQDQIKKEKLSATPRKKQLEFKKVGKAGVILVMKNQIKKEPRKEELMLCDICAEVFKSSASLQQHKNKMHFPKKLECEQCAREFRTKDNLRRHFSNLHGDKNFICYACGKSFGTNSGLTKHLKTVHSEKKQKYKCQFCETSYACRLSVIIHERSHHTGLRPAVCDICKKSFYHKVYLQEHMRLHTGERPFKCSVCGRGYAIRANMKSHMKNHKVADIDPDVVSKLRPSLLKVLKQ